MKKTILVSIFVLLSILISGCYNRYFTVELYALEFYNDENVQFESYLTIEDDIEQYYLSHMTTKLNSPKPVYYYLTIDTEEATNITVKFYFRYYGEKTLESVTINATEISIDEFSNVTYDDNIITAEYVYENINKENRLFNINYMKYINSVTDSERTGMIRIDDNSNIEGFYFNIINGWKIFFKIKHPPTKLCGSDAFCFIEWKGYSNNLQ